MLSTDRISNAFRAIIEEAEKLKEYNIPDPVKAGFSTIITIAKHQNDIRSSPKGSCKANDAA